MILALLLAAAPVPPTPAAETTGPAAAAVVQRYYAAIDRGDLRTAYGLWNGGYSFRQMKAGYVDTAHVRVETIPPFTPDPGAGSVYCEVRVKVTAIHRDRSVHRFAGSFTLRRVNDIDGSSAAQRRWHIENAKLQPVG